MALLLIIFHDAPLAVLLDLDLEFSFPCDNGCSCCHWARETRFSFVAEQGLSPGGVAAVLEARASSTVLDEVGYVPVAEIGAEFLFQVIAERAERAALIVTTNLPFSEWTQVFSNPRLCKALLDRITDRAHIIETGTESYRFRRTLEVRQKKKVS